MIQKMRVGYKYLMWDAVGEVRNNGYDL